MNNQVSVFFGMKIDSVYEDQAFVCMTGKLSDLIILHLLICSHGQR